MNKIIEEKHPIPKKEIPTTVQEAHRTQNRFDQKRNSPCHIMISKLNIQNIERILKSARQRDQDTYKGRLNRIIPDFPTETEKYRRAWADILQTTRDDKNAIHLLLPSILLY